MKDLILKKQKVISVNGPKKSKGWVKKEKIEYLTIEEIRELLGAEQNDYYYLLTRFLYESAARSGEAFQVKVKDLDLITGNVKIITLKQRDGVPERVLKISSELLSSLKERISNLELDKNDFLFAKGANESPVSRFTFYKHFAKLVLFLFGEDFKDKRNPHILRHSRAIHLLQEKILDISKLSRMLGHASLHNTMIYLRYSNNDINESLEKAYQTIKL